MSSITTERTVDELRLIFAQHGLPEEVVSDNGPQFISNEFSEFMSENGVKHILVPPYHPQSNGAAERSVRVVKEALVKQVLEGNRARSLKHSLADFLLRYRTTPHSTTGISPAELLMKRRLRTQLSLVKPTLAQAIETKQEKQKECKDLKNHRERQLSENDTARVRNTHVNGNSEKWILGTVVKVCGPRNYLVKTGYKTRFVHADHLIRAYDKEPNETSEVELLLESYQQSPLVLASDTVCDDICQPNVSAADVKSEPSFDQGAEGIVISGVLGSVRMRSSARNVVLVSVQVRFCKAVL